MPRIAEQHDGTTRPGDKMKRLPRTLLKITGFRSLVFIRSRAESLYLASPSNSYLPADKLLVLLNYRYSLFPFFLSLFFFFPGKTKPENLAPPRCCCARVRTRRVKDDSEIARTVGDIYRETMMPVVQNRKTATARR